MVFLSTNWYKASDAMVRNLKFFNEGCLESCQTNSTTTISSTPPPGKLFLLKFEKNLDKFENELVTVPQTNFELILTLITGEFSIREFFLMAF